MKRSFTLFFAIILTISITSCGKSNIENGIPVKLTVSCNEVVENLTSEQYAISEEKADIVPENGVIFQTNLNCDDNQKAYDLLIECLKNEKIHFEASDGYVKAVGNIYEGDCGKYSGWMFYVNGELAEVGSNDYVVKENDVIEFKYVVDYMKLFE